MLKKLAIILGSLCLIFMSAITIAGDLRSESFLVDTDFIACLYAGGFMVDHGYGREIYPTLNAENFYDQQFAVFVRNMLGKSDETWLYHFSYPPAVALLCAPFGLLRFREALMAWQLFCALGLAIASFCFARSPGSKVSPVVVFLVSCLFLPVLQTLVVGQNSLILGLLPLAVGYYFWQKERFLICGLAWSFIGLKPQLALPVAAIAGALVIAGLLRWLQKKEVVSILIGLIVGTLLLHLIPCLIFGFDIFPRWLHSIKLGGEAFAAEKSGYWQYHLFCSLPCVSILCFPQEQWLQIRPFAFGGGLLGLLSMTVFNATTLKLNAPIAMKRDLLMLLSVPLVFIGAPHLLLYDSCLMLVPAWIIFFRFHESNLFVRAAKIGAIILLLEFNSYLMAILLMPKLPDVHYQLVLMLSMLAYLLTLAFLKNKNESNTQSEGQS